MRTEPLVLMDDARAGRERLNVYSDCVRIIEATSPEFVMRALSDIGDAIAAGNHVAGFFSYEMGYALEPKLAPSMPAERQGPLLWFGVFRERQEFTDDEVDAWFAAHTYGRAYAGPLSLGETERSYAEKFARAKEYIAAGDIYQVNLTFPARFRFCGDPLALYARLRRRARAAHGAFIDPLSYGPIASLSPESFFSLANGRVTARPMKGTAPRGADAGEDARLKAWLKASEKDRAENLMIVDLIRNDLGRVARIGSVEVEELFEVETYPTLHTMVSTVHADLRDGTTPADVVRALFPCGSITGAPKIRAMEIIRELEPEPRGAYCGAIGAFASDGSAAFNVAIRTLTLPMGAEGTGRLNVGGAVVADSTARGEYEECLVKARYFTEGRPPIALIETLRFTPEHGFMRADLHLDRMARSAEALGLPFDPTMARMVMEATRTDHDLRVRLSLDETGHFACAVEAIAATEVGWTYAVSDHRVQSGDALSRFKTDWRDVYEGEMARLRRITGCDEVIFLNERDEVVEGSRTNVFLRRDGPLLTPLLSAGCLDGCLRRELLAQGEAVEATLTLADLARGAVYLGNSLRGLIEARPAAL